MRGLTVLGSALVILLARGHDGELRQYTEAPVKMPPSLLDAAAEGVPGPSTPHPKFVYYMPWANSDGARFEEGGQINITFWNGSALGHYDLSLGPPALTLITWTDDSTTAYPSSGSFYLEFDATYCVLRGNVSIAGSEVLEMGDMYYSRAGHTTGPLQALTPGAMVAVVGSPFEPVILGGEVNVDTGLITDAIPDDVDERFYFGRKADKIDDYAVPGAYDLNLDKLSLSDPPYRRVIWQENSFLGPHMHPTGIMYVPLSGYMCFPGEYCVDGGIGAVRWAAPGYFYDGELTVEGTGVDILVLGRDTPADFNDTNASSMPFVKAKHISMNRVGVPYV